MDYDLKLGLARPIKDEYVEGLYHHYIETIELYCGSNNPDEYNQPRHTIDDIEDLINHEVLHHVVQKVTGSILISHNLDNIVRKTEIKITEKLGLNLRNWSE